MNAGFALNTEIGTDLPHAAELLRSGQLVAFGTETVYGLGADATNSLAVASVFDAKGRPRFDPLIVHVPTQTAAQAVVADWPEVAEKLASAFWPGPLTMVLPKRDHIVDLVTSGLPSVGVRVPGHEPTRKLLEAVGCPVAAPSANRFGQVSPTQAEHVVEQLAGRISYVFDTGPCTVGVESTVVRIENNTVTLLRPGGVTPEQLADVCGSTTVAKDAEKGEMLSPDSPGQLPKHYAPKVPLRLGRPAQATSTDGLLAFGSNGDSWPGVAEVLSEYGDLAEAAANLFAAMRQIVDRGATAIYVDDIPDVGLGAAINDRLKRAAASA